MKFVPSNLKNEIKTTFSSIKDELSKYIYIYSQPSAEDCPNCFHDHTGASTNKFNTNFSSPVTIFGRVISPTAFTRGRCPVCLGKGKLEQDNKTAIKALIRWNPPGVLSNGGQEKTPGGVEGRNVVFVKTSKCYYELLRDSVKAVIDGIECSLYLPPTIRSLSFTDIVAEAYFISTGVGGSVRSG